LTGVTGVFPAAGGGTGSGNAGNIESRGFAPSFAIDLVFVLVSRLDGSGGGGATFAIGGGATDDTPLGIVIDPPSFAVGEVLELAGATDAVVDGAAVAAVAEPVPVPVPVAPAAAASVAAKAFCSAANCSAKPAKYGCAKS
jgi:hypothetical protein